MTTWVNSSAVTTTYTDTFSSQSNGYVTAGYMSDGYINGTAVWQNVAADGTVWS